MLTIAEAVVDPALFGRWFSAPSWRLWLVVLKAAFGLPLSDDERELLYSVAERDPPRRRVRELWVIAGRRAGKDSIASLIAAWFAAFVDYALLLRPGETANVVCLAVDRQQAKIVHRYAKAYFERVELLRGLVTRETADGLELSTGAELSVLASNFRSLRGRSIACAILDEIACWRSEDSAYPDAEIYQALLPGLATLPGSMIVGISSPYRRAGLLYEKWRAYYGKDDDDVLVIRAPSRVLNPTLDQRVIDDALARDPAAPRAEWLAEWRDDVSTFIGRELIEAAVDRGLLVRPPLPNVRYAGFCDPSGGVSDSFALAIAHAEGEAILLDCVVEIPAPFNPTSATKHMVGALKGYRLTSVTGDRYAASWTADAFAKLGVRYVQSEKDRSAIYADAMPLFTAGRARLVDNPRLVSQLAALERRTTPVGRDRIDHPAGGHDDVANAVAGALTLAAVLKRPLNISPVLLRRLSQPDW